MLKRFAGRNRNPETRDIMSLVTDVLEKLLLARTANERLGAERVLRLLAEVRRQVLVELATAPAETFAAYRAQQILSAIETQLVSWERQTASEITGLLNDAWAAGAEMLPTMARAAGTQVGAFWISTSQLDVLKEFTLGRFSAVRADVSARIRAEISLGILGQKTPQEVSAAIAGSLERPGVFRSIETRAEVITKTEMGRTFSTATQKSLEAASDTLPGLQKMWLHAGHPKRVRIYHLNIHGLTVGIDEKFLVGSIGMMYPRDPTAPASEVVNCGCTHVPFMPEWGTKKEFLASWAKTQKAANSRKS